MASRDGLLVRKLLEQGIVVQNGGDTPIAIRMRYVGTGSATSVTVAAGTLTTVSAEVSGTVTKVYTFATDSTTVGSLADNINSDGMFEAKVLDALRADVISAGSMLVIGAIVVGTDANGIAVFDVLVATSVFKAVTACISYNRNFDTVMLARSHRVHLNKISYWATVGGVGPNLVQVWLRKGGASGIGSNVETMLLGEISVSATTTVLDFGELGITGNDGDELIARLVDGTSMSNTGLSFRAVGILE